VSLEDSVKAKLRNRAILENRTFNEVLTIYGLERMLYRLSRSKYNDNFVLKGGILLYAIYEGKFKRGTADVDLLGYFVSNDVDTITNIFLEVFSIDCDLDGIIFNLDSLKVTKKY
jgi:predicted nucleotidyltransferase component of viral defense system